MRIIVHLNDPDDMIYAMRAVQTSIKNNYSSCGYGYGESGRCSVFVYRNKTGWTVRVQQEAP